MTGVFNVCAPLLDSTWFMILKCSTKLGSQCKMDLQGKLLSELLGQFCSVNVP